MMLSWRKIKAGLIGAALGALGVGYFTPLVWAQDAPAKKLFCCGGG